MFLLSTRSERILCGAKYKTKYEVFCPSIRRKDGRRNSEAMRLGFGFSLKRELKPRQQRLSGIFTKMVNMRLNQLLGTGGGRIAPKILVNEKFLKPITMRE